MVLGDLLQLDGRHAFPRHHRAIDDALGHRLGDLRQRHLHRRRAHGGQEFGADPRGTAHLQSPDIVDRFHFLVREMQERAIVQVHGDELDALELVERVLLDVVPQRRAARLGVLRHERQLEHLGLEETAGLVRRHGPDDVGHAVARLVEELRRRAAELHRRINLALDPAPRLLAELVAPRREELRLDRRLRRQEMMDPQYHLLRAGCVSGERECRADRPGNELDRIHLSSL